MKWDLTSFLNVENDQQTIFILTLILPPPLSLDTIFYLSDISPLKVLKIAEELVKIRYLSKRSQMGPGYYSLSDFDQVSSWIPQIPRELLFKVARKAVEKIIKAQKDTAKEWLTIAHIHDICQLPLEHFREMILAGNYCEQLNLSFDAAKYYLLALESMEKSPLDPEGKTLFIDAVKNICTFQRDALSPDTQIRLLNRALSYKDLHHDPENEIWLNVLLARSLTKTGKCQEATHKFETAWQRMSCHECSRDFRLKVALSYADFLFFQGFVDKAIGRYEAVIGNHEDLPPDRQTLRQCAFQGWIYGISGETARGLGLTEAVFTKSREIDAPEISVYATLMQVLILLEARLMSEIELYVNRLFEFDQIYRDHYVQWVGYAVKAFIAYWQKDFGNAFKYQNEVYKISLLIGGHHHRGAVNFEYMVGLEEKGLKHPYWNFDSEIHRIFSWPDIYMRGAALRYRALRTYMRKDSVDKAKKDLHESIALLQESGAKIELAQSKMLLARILIENKEQAKARELVRESWEVFSRVNPEFFPQDLKPYLNQDSKKALWMDSLLSVGEALGAIRNRRELLTEIVRQGMRIVGAERGAIFLKIGETLETAASRNMETCQIASDAFASQLRTIEEVLATGKERIKKETGIGWMGCVPIRMKAKVMGVIYLDCTLIRLDLSEDEVRLLRIMSNQAAVALDNLFAYEKISHIKDNLEVEADYYRQSCVSRVYTGNMVGSSPPFKKLIRMIEQVAASDATVMLTGETGVGKDRVAHSIHLKSLRAKRPFIAVNLVSLSPELFASELFGHEKGAFTGAVQSRQGRFELACDGTLFLDDIDAFSLDIQAKMLRVLETKEFERVGGSKTLKTRFRLIAASNRDLEDLVEKGLFRSDFYYRLNVFPIKVPSLRDRKEDIPAISHYFMERFQRKTGKQFNGISKKSMQQLMDYHWPGNIRELRHVIERAVLMCRDGCLTVPPLDDPGMQSAPTQERLLTLKEVEIAHIIKVLQVSQGKVSGPGGAAQILDLKPSTLYAKLKRLGLERGNYKPKNT